MDWLKRNILTCSLLLFAVAAFITELARALPPGEAADLAKLSLVVVGAARGLVCSAEALSSTHDKDATQ